MYIKVEDMYMCIFNNWRRSLREPTQGHPFKNPMWRPCERFLFSAQSPTSCPKISLMWVPVPLSALPCFPDPANSLSLQINILRMWAPKAWNSKTKYWISNNNINDNNWFYLTQKYIAVILLKFHELFYIA